MEATLPGPSGAPCEKWVLVLLLLGGHAALAKGGQLRLSSATSLMTRFSLLLALALFLVLPQLAPATPLYTNETIKLPCGARSRC